MEIKERGRCPVCNYYNETLINKIVYIKRKKYIPTGYPNYPQIQEYIEELKRYTCERCGAKWKERNELQPLENI
jgi:hypothetical protein